MDRISDVREQDGNLVERHNCHRICQQAGRPAQPNATSIVAAIDRLIADSRTGGGPEIEFYDDLPIDELPSEVQTAVFPVVQELLLNACRHSKSKGILVGLTQDDESLCIQVQDWGVGFNPDTIAHGHYGIEGIRRRVKLLHGIAAVHSSPGEGTLITVALPLKE
jgi:signal transduction histidine kinase